tara:strand:- start:1176 stop:1544 length:369 start_codon:yes stop_codon:yes gene_type:complete
MIKQHPPTIAANPMRDRVKTMLTIPPSIDTPAVQFSTPKAAPGLPSVGGRLDVHDPGSSIGAAVCPHEHPSSSKKARETSIDMTAALPTRKPPEEERWNRSSDRSNERRLRLENAKRYLDMP